MDLEETTKRIQDRESIAFGMHPTFETKQISAKPCFSGCIDTTTLSKITLGYNPSYVEESEDLQEIVNDPFGQAFEALVDHELNHKGGGQFRGCPRNLDLHIEAILEPLAEALQEKGIPNAMIGLQNLYAYMANLVEDVLDNSDIGSKKDHLGMFLLYHDDGHHTTENRFSPLFDAFVQLQEILYGDEKAYQLMKKHYTGKDEVNKAITSVLDRLGIADMARPKAMSYLLDEKNWAEISRVIAEEFIELVDKNQLQDNDYVKENFMPLKGEKDAFDKDMENPEKMMKYVMKKYNQSLEGKEGSDEEEMPGHGEEEGKGFKPPAFMKQNDALDLVYRKLARDMIVKTLKSTENDSMVIARYGREEADLRRDKRWEIEFNEGKLRAMKKPFEITEDLPYEQSKGTVPTIRMIIRDESGSMRAGVESDPGMTMNPWAPEEQQWGNRSRYHHTLLAEWSLYDLLERHGTLRHASVKSVAYSSISRAARTVSDAKKQALNPHFGGRTYLDMNTIDELMGKDELVISISDGEIQNWDSWLVAPEKDKKGIKVKDAYIKKAKENEFCHIQIGVSLNSDGTINESMKPQMCKDLEAAGVMVCYDDGRNISKYVIDFTLPRVTGGRK